ncbi:hypothetical protein JTB14_007928 [Gonioctena quinquepunctata]|nr:hypothetical protein JTB14_007928 [Gonioctena quinquepunctata]
MVQRTIFFGKTTKEPECPDEDHSPLLSDSQVQDYHSTLSLDSQVQAEIMELPDINPFSKFNRLIRSTAWIFHFRKIICVDKKGRPGILASEMASPDGTDTMWMEKYQNDCFPGELYVLKKNKASHVRSAVEKCFNSWQVCRIRKCKPVPPVME